MRNEFINHLIKLAELNPKIVLVVGDLGYGVVEKFADKFPHRFFNSGVAEQNMMGFSAGLASEGFHVFVYSIANFPIFRCAEQIRNDVCYHNYNVTIVSVGGGLSYGNLGYSHHAVQDYAFMRSLPNMKILSPGDPNEVIYCLDTLHEQPGPAYLRLGKVGELNHTDIIKKTNSNLLNPIKISNSANSVLITTGAILQDVMLFYGQIDIKFDILSCPIWGINEKSSIREELHQYDRIVTVEDHLIDAGFGSWILESMDPNSRSKVRIIGLKKDVCGMVGGQRLLNEKGGITPQAIDAAMQS